MEVIEKIRKDDFIITYWKAGGGNFAWLVERKEQLFFFVVLGMQRLTYQWWAFENYKQVDLVRTIMSCLGFQEIPVYSNYNNAKPVIDILLKDISCYEENAKKAREEMLKVQEQEKAEKINGEQNEDQGKNS